MIFNSKRRFNELWSFHIFFKLKITRRHVFYSIIFIYSTRQWNLGTLCIISSLLPLLLPVFLSKGIRKKILISPSINPRNKRATVKYVVSLHIKRQLVLSAPSLGNPQRKQQNMAFPLCNITSDGRKSKQQRIDLIARRIDILLPPLSPSLRSGLGLCKGGDWRGTLRGERPTPELLISGGRSQILR